MPSVSLPTKFNEEGECDLFFYKRHIAFHIIDTAIRLGDGEEIPNKEMSTLLDAYVTSWVQRHGPFTTLYMDGESGMNNDTAKAELKRLGTDLRVRARGQHPHYIDARSAMLGTMLHPMEEELKRYNYTIPLKRLLGEAIFVCNAFSFFNCVSP